MAPPPAALRHRRPSPLTALLVIVCATVYLGLLLSGRSPMIEGRLPDTDDYMRLAQVADLLDGASWWDPEQRRLAPPDGTPMHWSRLADIPIAAVALVAEPVTGRTDALLIAAALVPGLVLAAFAAACSWAAVPLLGRGRAPIAGLMAITQFAAMGQLMPGRVDHHGLQMTFAALLTGATLRMLLRPTATAAAIGAGLAGAAGLWVGAEALPWVGLHHAILGGAWVVGRLPALTGARSAGALSLGTAAALLATRSPGTLLTPVCDAIGAPYVGTALAATAVWAALAVAERRVPGPSGRVAAGAVCGGAALALLALAFPGCGAGPYANVSPRLYDAWMAKVIEAQPLTSLFHGTPWLIPLYAAGPVLAAAVSLAAAIMAPPRRRTLWAAAAAGAVAVVALSCWQVRAMSFAGPLASAPLGWLAATLWGHCRGARPAARVLGRVGAVAMAGPVAGILLPIAALSAVMPPGAPGGGRCDIRPATAALSAAAPGRIASFIDLGPEILFRTHHAVLSAPYHRAGDGILAAMDFFSATPDEARAIADQRGITHVLACTGMPEAHFYAATGESLMAHLAENRPPEWLVAIPQDEPRARLFAVRRP